MKMTPELKSWLIDQKLVEADETDDAVFSKAAADAVVSGQLPAAKLAELQTEKAAAEGSKLLDALNAIAEGVKSNAAEIAAMKAAPAPAPEAPAAPAPTAEFKGVGVKANVAEASATEDAPESGTLDKSPNIRVRGVEEDFDNTKSPLRYPAALPNGMPHPKSGQVVTEGSRQIMEQSQLDKALAGMWFKYMLKSSTNNRGVPAKLRMNEQDEKLLQYAMKESRWGGVLNPQNDGGTYVENAKLTPSMQKALLDDGTSGGLEIAPIAFDDAIITTPLLYGELFPKVNLVSITRGRRIEGASISNVTMSWGGGDGTNISLFNTASFVAAFDTNIFVVDGAIEIGLDFMSDSAVDVGPHVTDSYGRRLLAELDKVIAVGDGSTQPEGIMTASGTTSVSAENTTTGPPTVGDYEGLLFGVPKQYKQGFANNQICFCGNETSYQRARSIAVGASDQRRVFGMDHENYMLLNRPYAIQGDLTNSQIFFGVMPRYRMYRRLGLTMRSSTEGSTLIRANKLLVTARGRFGGQIEDGTAFAVTTNAQNA